MIRTLTIRSFFIKLLLQITIVSIPPRLDSWRVGELNKIWKQVCKAHSIAFLDTCMDTRTSKTWKLNDKIHLSIDHGLPMMMKKIIHHSFKHRNYLISFHLTFFVAFYRSFKELEILSTLKAETTVYAKMFLI